MIRGATHGCSYHTCNGRQSDSCFRLGVVWFSRNVIGHPANNPFSIYQYRLGSSSNGTWLGRVHGVGTTWPEGDSKGSSGCAGGLGCHTCAAAPMSPRNPNVGLIAGIEIHTSKCWQNVGRIPLHCSTCCSLSGSACLTSTSSFGSPTTQPSPELPPPPLIAYRYAFSRQAN